MASSTDGSDWIAYTPNGFFDASLEGDRRVTWNPTTLLDADREAIWLHQWADLLHVYGLTTSFISGNSPAPPQLQQSPPPQVTLRTVSPYDPNQREVNLEIRVGSPGADRLTIYHRGVAVESRELSLADFDELTLEVSLTLTQGLNDIYALASRPQGIDGLSPTLELQCDRPADGLLHILSIGVSQYPNSPKEQHLKFAHDDAEAVADLLSQRAIKGVGLKKVFTEEEATREAIERALDEIRVATMKRPEDSVVVFMAGHTDIRGDYLCLLLQDAELPELQIAQAVGDGELLVRGAIADGQNRGRRPPRLNGDDVLPYYVIHRGLSNIRALNRLVIIDACQAEALHSDPGVQMVTRWMADRDAYEAKTSYILAARRGERAFEADKLRHGLLSYSLLYGLGYDDLKIIPESEIFDDWPTADLDRDLTIRASELRQYAEETLPPLVAHFVEQGLVVSRGRRGQEAIGVGTSQTGDFPIATMPELP